MLSYKIWDWKLFFQNQQVFCLLIKSITKGNEWNGQNTGSSQENR